MATLCKLILYSTLCGGFMLLFASNVESSGKILMYSPPGGTQTSYFQIGLKVAKEVTKLGYHVTIVTGIPDANDAHGDVMNKRYGRNTNITVKLYDSLRAKEMLDDIVMNGIDHGDGYDSMVPLLNVAFMACELLLENKELLSYFHKKRYDMVIGPSLNPCHVVLGQQLKIEKVAHFHFALPDILRFWQIQMDNKPQGLDSGDSQELENKMSSSKILIETLFAWYGGLVETRKLGSHADFVDNFCSKSNLWILNADSTLDGDRLSTGNAVMIGGATAKDADRIVEKRLPGFIEKSRPNGYMVFSINTVLQTIPLKEMNKFVDAFNRLPISVIWKHNGLAPRRQMGNNVFLLSWMPYNDMNDLIGGSNLSRAFLTTGGRTGIFEAIYHAIPVLCLPITVEHKENCKKVEQIGLGRTLSLEECSEEDIIEAVNDITKDSRYQETAERLSKRIKFESANPTKRAALRIDRLLKFGISTAPNADDQPEQTRESELQRLTANLGLRNVLCLFFIIVIIFIVSTFPRSDDCSKAKSE